MRYWTVAYRRAAWRLPGRKHNRTRQMPSVTTAKSVNQKCSTIFEKLQWQTEIHSSELRSATTTSPY